MRYRNMDHALRGMVLAGARGIEPSEIHESWKSPQDQGVYAKLVNQLDVAIQQRLGGSNLLSGEDIIQQEMTTGMLEKVGSAIHKPVFRRHVSVLATSATPLRAWLQRRVVDQAKRKEERGERIVKDAPEFWQVVQDQIARRTLLGEQVLNLLLEEIPGRGDTSDCLRDLLLNLGSSSPDKIKMMEFASRYGISTMGRYPMRFEQAVRERLREEPELLRKIEQIYYKEAGYEEV